MPTDEEAILREMQNRGLAQTKVGANGESLIILTHAGRRLLARLREEIHTPLQRERRERAVLSGGLMLAGAITGTSLVGGWVGMSLGAAFGLAAFALCCRPMRPRL